MDSFRPPGRSFLLAREQFPTGGTAAAVVKKRQESLDTHYDGATSSLGLVLLSPARWSRKPFRRSLDGLSLRLHIL